MLSWIMTWSVIIHEWDVPWVLEDHEVEEEEEVG
jgi:hypothetical protein